SGMKGEPTNDAPYSFWSTDPDAAADRLAAILRAESEHGPVVLTTYDERGGYEHPDHVQVHRVGHRAAQRVPGVRLFESTMNRDHIRRLMRAALESDDPATESLRSDMRDSGEQPDDFNIGMPEEAITHAIDVSDFVDLKRQAMRAHASQIPEEAFFLAMPDETFRDSFGIEWYIEPGSSRPGGPPFADDLFAGLG